MDIIRVGVGVVLILIIFYATGPLWGVMIGFVNAGEWDWFEKAILMLIPAIALFFALKYYISGRNQDMVGSGGWHDR